MGSKFSGVWSVVVGLLVVVAGCGGETGEPEFDNDGESGDYNISAAVSGLEHGEVVLEEPDLGEAVVDTDGTTTLWEGLEDGADYDIELVVEPSEHTCQIDDGAGTIDGAGVTVGVDCEFDDVGEGVGIEIDDDASQLDIVEGEVAIVAFEASNRGDEEVVRETTLSLEEHGEVDDADVELPGEGSEAVSLQWETEPGDVGYFEATVATGEGESDTALIAVSERSAEAEDGQFDVAIDEEASTLTVDAGQEVVVEAEVQNQGDMPRYGDVDFAIDGQVEATGLVGDLEAGETTEVVFDWSTDESDIGESTAEVSTVDDTDSATMFVADPDVEATLAGEVVDEETGDEMVGVDVVLLDDDGEESQRVTTDDEGTYLFVDLEAGDYEMILEAPGLNPDYELEASGGDNLDVTVDEGPNSRDLSVDWLDEFDLFIDGGEIDFQYDTGGPLAVDLPGCQQQDDGSWEPTDTQPDNDDIEISYDPSGECFRIEDIGVDIETGELEMTTDNLVFPDINIVIDDEDDDFHDDIDEVDADFEWLFDELAGDVDYIDGSMDLDLDFRMLFGGTVVAYGLSVDFGAEDGYDDCQFVGAWGGDVDDPTEDDDDLQVGDYLHDPIEMNLTTGESGPEDVIGSPYDADQRVFVTVDNELEVGELSEGEFGEDHPGGASCGDLDASLVGVQEDYAEQFNSLADLPATEGSVFGEFDFLVP